MNRNFRQNTRSFFTGRRALGPLLGAVVSVCVCADVFAVSEENLPSGRLGYTWVPDPPKQPRTESEELGLEIAKYGGGSLLGLWILRRMFGGE